MSLMRDDSEGPNSFTNADKDYFTSSNGFPFILPDTSITQTKSIPTRSLISCKRSFVCNVISIGILLFCVLVKLNNRGAF